MNANAAAFLPPILGIQKWTTESGIRSIRLHYSAFPARDPATTAGKTWRDTMTKGLAGGMENQIWRKEQEIDFSIREGLPIYKTFNEQRHVAPKPLRAVKNIPMIRGWDFGGTPACAITQRVFMPAPHWNIFPSLFVPNDQFMGISRFGTEVINYCNLAYPGHSWLDYADPAGNQRSQTDERKCFDILNGDPNVPLKDGGGFGLSVQTGEVSWQGRFEAMEMALQRSEEDGVNFLQVDPRERFIITAFTGGYRRKKVIGKDIYSDEVDKNEYSHIMNGLEYVASRIFSIKKAGPRPRPVADISSSYAT